MGDPVGSAFSAASRRPGLYLHVPFCSAICPYCDFAVLTGGRRAQADFVDSLAAEIELWRVDGARWETIDTVYFGGGTPSALEPAELARILAAARAALPIAADAWIALEANPEDVAAESVRQWRELEVSMLSLGVQSFDAETLRFLGRRHTPVQARRAVELALDAGFPTVSIDLIYGTGDTSRQERQGPPRMARESAPGASGDGVQTLPSEGYPAGNRDARLLDSEAAPALARWQRDLEQAVALGPHHLSCYQLTIHEGTPFGFRAARGELRELPEADQAEIFRLTHAFLAGKDYPAYEVSNFASAARHQSRHNRKYWDHTPYLGLGPSAHSFDGRRRWWNERKLRAWQGRLAAGERPVAGGEELGRRELALEEVMLSLRTAAGIDLDGFHRRHGWDLAARNQHLVSDLAARGLLAERRGRLVPSPEGLAVADSLARSFELEER
jgi:oxygen-independent coproporphyrinogen-3 oxidase